MAAFDLETPETNETDNLVWLGHLSPDSDTIGSAIGAAELFGGEPRRAGELNKETAFVMDYCGAELPKMISVVEGQKVGLVDFNQKTQLHPCVDMHDIVAIIDHHAIQDQPITFNTVISMDIRPWGSAATILADRFEKMGKVPTKSTACVLLAGILSDTLVFESPTTTVFDRPFADKLGKIAGIDDVVAFGNAMMEAKSDLADVSTYDVLKGDFKHYEIHGKKVGYGVAETLKPDMLIERKAEFLQEMEKEKAKQGLDFIFFAIVDTKNKQSHLVIFSDAEAELAAKAYGATTESNWMELPGFISRKKQLMPMIQETLSA
ncbi:MAG TPA: manganese-dependent inorganic pyrophosphatase [Oceanospirillales bacterium]|nr:manganese-dependent inorganic pyrophosphatase [Oleispira sp.]HCM04882.1 manganese-dependent inorganic pyrophosphatase [Oceanospirillales bacterium]|tara:strand:- start:3230 stop:4189 length:960 start_codon:yes stop_codon:yes gene_type:complete